MFQTIKNLFTKVVQLTSSFFLPSEIIEEEFQPTGDFEPSKAEVQKQAPKIKQLKYRQQAKYR